MVGVSIIPSYPHICSAMVKVPYRPLQPTLPTPVEGHRHNVTRVGEFSKPSKATPGIHLKDLGSLRFRTLLLTTGRMFGFVPELTFGRVLHIKRFCIREGGMAPALEPSGINLKRFKDFHLNAKAESGLDCRIRAIFARRQATTTKNHC